jgi:hypothetical protein
MNVPLPILTKDNSEQYPEWHTYYKTVYGTPISNPVDLNTFNFFYNYSPICNNINIHNIFCDGQVQSKYSTLPYGSYITFKGKPIYPEVIISSIGFFVKRKLSANILNGDYIEIIRTSGGEGLHERGVMWFYHTIGSGLFIRNNNLTRIILYCDSKLCIHFKKPTRNTFTKSKKYNVTNTIQSLVDKRVFHLTECIRKLPTKKTYANTAKLCIYKKISKGYTLCGYTYKQHILTRSLSRLKTKKRGFRVT